MEEADEEEHGNETEDDSENESEQDSQDDSEDYLEDQISEFGKAGMMKSKMAKVCTPKIHMMDQSSTWILVKETMFRRISLMIQEIHLT